MKAILSIDGGGIRGIIPSLILKEIESRTNKPIYDCFDLLAGTSTGGIISLGLSIRKNSQPIYSAHDIYEIYEKKGREIFPRTLWEGISNVANYLIDERYSANGIERVLGHYFGDITLGEIEKKVIIPTYDIHNRKPLVFKSWESDFRFTKIKDIARATSAAPTYFEPAHIQVGSKKMALIDGGIYMNSPSVSALSNAMEQFEGEDLFLLSLGTGENTRVIDIEKAKQWGKLEWAAPLINCIFDGVSDITDQQMKLLLGSNYIRIQTKLINCNDDLDDASNTNIFCLTQKAEQLIGAYDEIIDTICRKVT